MNESDCIDRTFNVRLRQQQPHKAFYKLIETDHSQKEPSGLMMDILMLTRLWKCQKSKYQLRIYLLSNEHYSQYYSKAHNNFLSPNANQLEMGDNVIKMEMNLFCTPVNVFHVTRV